MKVGRLWEAFLVALLLSATNVGAATTDAVGHITVTVRGPVGEASSALSFLGIGLIRPALYRGTVQSVAGTKLETKLADWADSLVGAKPETHYVEITSGPVSGHTLDILEVLPDTMTLVLAGDLSQLLVGGEKFKIRRHWTLSDLFGAQNEAGLTGGSNTTADEILTYDPATGLYTTYFYKTTGLGGTGWRSTRSTSVDESQAPLNSKRGILVRRKHPGDVRIKVFGEIKAGDSYLSILPGLNMIANVYPTDGLTLGTCGLYTGDPATGLSGGSNITADKVLIYNGSTYDSYYYKTQGLGGTGWRSTANTSADASSTPIPAGVSVLVQRSGSGPGFYWLLKQPY